MHVRVLLGNIRRECIAFSHSEKDLKIFMIDRRQKHVKIRLHGHAMVQFKR